MHFIGKEGGDLNIYIKDITGERNINYQGYEMIVLNYKNSRDMMIEFQDEHKTKVKCQKGTFEKGTVSNPFHPTIYNVGYLGNLPQLSVPLRDFHPYNVWRLMLRRCYDTKSKPYETYRNCIVCKDWFCFSSFLKWHNVNYYEIDGVHMQLDKDILSNENKTYSPDTCIYVPADINEMFKIQRKDRNCPQGVFYHKRDKAYVYYSYKHKKTVGNYKTVKDAHLDYLKDKQEAILERAEFYKNDIPNKLYLALINYKVVV